MIQPRFGITWPMIGITGARDCKHLAQLWNRLPLVNHNQEDLMGQVTLNLGRLSVTDKIATGRHIVSKLTDNTSFPDPHPSLTEVTTAVDELETAFGRLQSARSEVTTRIGTQDNAERNSIRS